MLAQLNGVMTIDDSRARLQSATHQRDHDGGVIPSKGVSGESRDTSCNDKQSGSQDHDQRSEIQLPSLVVGPIVGEPDSTVAHCRGKGSTVDKKGRVMLISPDIDAVAC